MVRLESCLTTSWRLAIIIPRCKSRKQSLLRDLTLQNARLVELWFCKFLITSFEEMNPTWKRLILKPIYYLHQLLRIFDLSAKVRELDKVRRFLFGSIYYGEFEYGEYGYSLLLEKCFSSILCSGPNVPAHAQPVIDKILFPSD
uniref:Uncharacterized protein n=1 Tax=Ananas comosus var. bracteatus TaxID=296719 RepID=A0A6V7PCW8_ANACO|nr:unnamed protein product [Ananas comosus var. bracteatus]